MAGALLAPEIGVLAGGSLLLQGALLDVVLINLFFYRLTFKRIEEGGAAYWIRVGASAITALAAATLAHTMAQTHALAELLPFIKGIHKLGCSGP